MKKLQKLLLLSCLLAAPNAHAEKGKAKDSWKITAGILTKLSGDFLHYGGKSDFAPSAIPLDEDEQKRQRFIFDACGTSLGLEKQLLLGETSLKLVAQTSLSTEALKLKKAYTEWGGLLLGLSSSNFGNGDSFPDTLTGDVPCSAVSATVTQIAWKQAIGGGLRCVVAVEKALQPDLYPGAEEKDRATKALIPDKNLPAVAANLRYEKAFGHVQLGGLLRVFDYHETGVGDAHYAPTGGVNVSSVLKVIPDKTNVKFCALYGTGIGGYVVDFGSVSKKERKDFYLENDKDITPKPIDSWGGFAGLEQRWFPKVRSTFAYGYIHTTDELKRGGNSFQQGHFGSASLTYHPTEQLSFGLEYLYGHRTLIADRNDQKDAHRIQAALKFSL